MTEEIAATPGWVEERLDELFASLPQTPAVAAARTAYLTCLATRKAPAAPSDMLGAEFNACRPSLHAALRSADVDPANWASLDLKLEALEAEFAADS